MPKLKTWLAAAGLLTLMACGGSETAPAAPGAPETPQDAAAPTSSSDSAASAAFVRPEGLPETAIPVTDLEGRVYWVEARENGRVALYSFTDDGQAGATAGTFEQLQEAYPTLDLSPLADQMDMAGETAADAEAASGIEALRATQDGLVAATPGAQ